MGPVDLDAYSAVHRDEWERLVALTGRRRLSGPESDELADLYLRVGTHLSVVRAQAPDTAVVQYLSTILLRARNRVVGTRTSTWAGTKVFFTHRFPAALYRLRRWWIITMLVNVGLAAVIMVWMVGNPSVEQSLMTQEDVRQLIEHDFEDYYSEYAASHFAAQVWVNNAWVTAQCLALGVLGLPVLWLLAQNMVNVAVIGAVMHRHGHGGHFWGLILPHGMLELTCVFVAGGVGLRLFWSWIAPGDLSRSRSLAREGRTAGTVALGLVVVLFISGVIEGFVTPSGLPTWGRVGIGVLAWTSFMAYVYGPGRRAVQEGFTGDLDAALLEDRVASRA